MSQREVLAQQTYVPEDAQDVAEVHSFLAAHEAARGEGVPRRFLLVGGAEHEQVEIPQQVYEVLCQVVEAMSAGKAVTVAPHSTSLTTQQAADLLGVSRPTVVKLTDSGEIPVMRVGSRRKVLLTDVLAYREQRRQRQYDMLAETAVDIDEDETLETVTARLREARRAVAAKRRTS